MATPLDPPPVVLTGTGLTVGELIALADGEAVPAVAPEARERAVRSWRAAQRLAAEGRLYGRGTGVGAHRSVTVEEGDESAHGLRLLRSHAGGAGALLPARQVRAMLAVRANQLLAGGSGIQPAFVDALAEALRLGVHPAVNEYGGIGTGDLTALAQTGLTLIGERPWVDAAPSSSPEAAARPGPVRPEAGTRGGTPANAPDGDLFDSADAAWRIPDRPTGPDGEMVGWPNVSWRGPGPDPAAHPAQSEPGAPTAAIVPPVVTAGGGPAGSTVVFPTVARAAQSEPDAPPAEITAAEVRPAPAGPRALPAPVALRPGDALALLSSNALALGQAALAQHGLDVLLRATHAVAALSLAAVGGSAQAYAAAVHAPRPYPGPARAAGEVRRLLGIGDGSGAAPGRRIQDPFGFRAFPQAHGCALEACERLRTVVEVEINCPSENPLVAPDGTTAHHHGGFFAAPLGLALDAANLALLQTAQLSVARLAALGDPDLTGLPAFLAAGPASSSGTMILEYTANSALAELRSCAAPASAGHAVLSHGLEEAASFAGQAARQTLRAAEAYGTVLACELVTAVRALRLRPVPPPVPAYTLAAAALPLGTDDRPLTGDLTAAAELLPRLARL
ncbi:aromatic amino acid lyase [Streptomyces sp. NBC_00582]|uniref:aromatic amino acid lyase n=1 Tax=Streptomyces sp. NBC_00582 TaxID=2975783 RepID=UPI002E81B0E5|nr:aromatic amino acid lyase [Streptomyces sp. NBC_00582]WUB61228.1 aromatic amino acid lyase [Streptomyces sp. NBC_00582]